MSRLLIISLILAALSLVGGSLMISNRLHSQTEQHLDRIDNQQVEIATLKLQRQFNDMKFELAQRQTLYSMTHRKIEDTLLTGKSPDLAALKAKFSAALGFEIDLFLVNADLVVTESTYTPDIGLDFNAPYFTDAQAAFSQAKITKDIVLGQPTLEIISLQHKIYTVSHLEDGRFLEVGFLDPAITAIFNKAQDIIMAEQGLLSVEFYAEHNKQRLSPLTQLTTFEPMVSKHQDKAAYLALVDEYLASQYPYFKDLGLGEFQAIKRAGKPNESFFYVVLYSAKLTPNYELRVIGKLHALRAERTWWEQYNYLIVIVMALMTLGILLLTLWQNRRKNISTATQQLN